MPSDEYQLAACVQHDVGTDPDAADGGSNAAADAAAGLANHGADETSHSEPNVRRLCDSRSDSLANRVADEIADECTDATSDSGARLAVTGANATADTTAHADADGAHRID